MTIVRIVALTALLLSYATVGSAQVVQLPTLHTFSLETSVLVPDGGTTSLGGISRSASGSRSSHSLGSRPNGSARSASNASVSVQIIDLEALDKAIRQQAAPKLNYPTV